MKVLITTDRLGKRNKGDVVEFDGTDLAIKALISQGEAVVLAETPVEKPKKKPKAKTKTAKKKVVKRKAKKATK